MNKIDSFAKRYGNILMDVVNVGLANDGVEDGVEGGERWLVLILSRLLACEEYR